MLRDQYCANCSRAPSEDFHFGRGPRFNGRARPTRRTGCRTGPARQKLFRADTGAPWIEKHSRLHCWVQRFGLVKTAPADRIHGGTPPATHAVKTPVIRPPPQGDIQLFEAGFWIGSHVRHAPTSALALPEHGQSVSTSGRWVRRLEVTRHPSGLLCS